MILRPRPPTKEQLEEFQQTDFYKGYQAATAFFTDRPVIDADHILRQKLFSEETFGPGDRTAGVIDHIKKELEEIEKEPTDLEEWADVIILAIDGAWRVGHEPQAIIDMIKFKQAKNETRDWPDWKVAEFGKAIEHIK